MDSIPGPLSSIPSYPHESFLSASPQRRASKGHVLAPTLCAADQLPLSPPGILGLPPLFISYARTIPLALSHRRFPLLPPVIFPIWTLDFQPLYN